MIEEHKLEFSCPVNCITNISKFVIKKNKKNLVGRRKGPWLPELPLPLDPTLYYWYIAAIYFILIYSLYLHEFTI